MDKAIHPSLTQKQFESLGFRKAYWRNEPETGGTWSIRFVKELNPDYQDEIEIQWFCGAQRYSIMRQTESLKNIFLFEGFINSVEDLNYLMSLFDLSRFYEQVEKRNKPFLIGRP